MQSDYSGSGGFVRAFHLGCNKSGWRYASLAKEKMRRDIQYGKSKIIGAGEQTVFRP